VKHLHRKPFPFFLLLVAQLTPVFLFAQEDKERQIDSLRQLLAAAPDTQKARVHTQMSFLFTRTNVDSAVAHAERAMAIASAVNDSSYIAMALVQRAVLQVNSSDYEAGIDNALKAYRVYVKAGSDVDCSFAANIIGNAYVGAGYPQTALKWYKTSLSFGEKTGNEFKIAVALFGIGNIEYELKLYDSSMTHYQRCETLFLKLGRKREAMASLLTRAKIIYDKKDPGGALALLRSAQRDVEALNDLYLLGFFYRHAGLCHNALGEYGLALKHHHTARRLFEEIKAASDIRTLYADMAETHYVAGDADSAYQYLQRYNQINDSLFQSENQEKIAEMQAKYESIEKDKKLLENDILIQQKANQQRLLLIGLGIAFLLAAVAGLSYRRKQLANRIIAAEKKKSDELLLNILPQETAEELKQFGSAKARSFEMVTVMFTDFKGFTAVAEKLGAEQLVQEINEYFVAFDGILQRHGVEKIKTIGDAYMAAGGLPTPKATHAVDVVKAALDIQAFIREQKMKKGGAAFDIRIGIHSGPVVAGIVGVKKFAYDIWGDTVNTAARMESSGVAGKINISAATYELVKEHFRCMPRGKVNAKGKGEIDMYFLGESSGAADYEAASAYILARLHKELPADYYYHNAAHTLDVLRATEELAQQEGVTDEEALLLLRTAALYHDTGFLDQYADNEPAGARIAAETLPEFGYSPEQIETIRRIILATAIKAVPVTLPEKILKDADLDYLGRSDYKLLSLRLKQEWEHQGLHKTMPEWYAIQIQFLSGHRYYTSTAKRLREPEKQKQLHEIKQTAEMWKNLM